MVKFRRHLALFVAGAVMSMPLPSYAQDATSTTEAPETTPSTAENTDEKDTAEDRVIDARGGVQKTVEAIAHSMSEMEKTKFQISDIKEQIPVLQKRINVLQGQLNQRAVEIYTAHSERASDALAAAAGSVEAQRKATLTDAVASHDIKVADALKLASEKLAKMRTELDGAIERQHKIQEKLDEQKRALETELIAAEAELARLEKELNFVRSDGKLCPADGFVAFSNDWGQPRSGGRTHKGTDVFAQFGTPAVAIVSGRADTNEDDLGGHGIWLYGDDGNSYYYAHLDSFAITSGQQVAQGDVVGFVGDSGNAKGGSPHIHFEVHPGNGDAVNPYSTLNRLCVANRLV